MQTITAKDSKSLNADSGKTSSASWRAFAAVFFSALACALIFHLTADGAKRTLCFDARQYIFDTARITDFLLSIFHGKMDGKLVTDADFLTSILVDGPAFPSIFASFFALMGHAPGIQDCRAIEVIQSFMHAISATLIFNLSLTLCKKRSAALFAGLGWALYPAAIFWSGIFYTETTVILFTLLFVTALLNSRKLLIATVAGMVAGIVALLKPALLPAAAMASLLQLRFSKKNLLLAVLGTLLALAPWMAYTKVMTGQVKVTANRFPAFNLAMGADSEVDGCLVSPAPPLTTMFSKDDATPYAFPMSQWEFHTVDCLRMAAVKLSSLWTRQANDFRQSFFGVSPQIQNIWQLILLTFGLSGIFAFLFQRKRNMDLQQQVVAYSSLIFVATHFCYILFTPAARYGMTAMPFFLIFGAYIVSRLIEKKQPLRLNLTYLVVSAAMVALLSQGTTLSPIFEQAETVIPLTPGQSVEKKIDLASIPFSKEKYSDVLLLVDGDDATESGRVTINGHKLSALQHIRSFESELYKQSFELRSLGYPAGLATDQFRHWRAVSVPIDYLNFDDENSITFTAGNACKIYADPSNSRNMLAVNYFSVNSLCNSDTSCDLRVPSPVKTGNVKTVSIADGKPINESLRMRLAFAINPNKSESISASKQTITQIYEKSLVAKDFDLYVQDPPINGIRINRVNMKAARSTGAVIDLPQLPKSGWLKVTVEGDVLGKNEGKAEVVVALQPGKQSPAVVLNMAPQNLPYNTSQWKHFVIQDTMPAKLLADGKQSIYIAAYPGAWLDFCGYTADKKCGDAQFKNFKFKIEHVESGDLAGSRLLFY